MQRFVGVTVVFWFAAMMPGVAEKRPVGTVIAVGGGSTPEAAVRAFIAAAGGPEARIVVLAQTQEEAAEGGADSAAMLRELGAKQVEAPANVPPAAIIARLESARGVWIPGGDQTRLTQVFPEASGVPAAIRAVRARGGVVGGTSAGASLMGSLMPTGPMTDERGFKTGVCPVAPGLGVLNNILIDQHFLARQRLPRMLTALLENPRCIGIGLDQGAWMTVRNGAITIAGGQILLARVTGKPRRQSTLLGTDGLMLKILLPGDRARL